MQAALVQKQLELDASGDPQQQLQLHLDQLAIKEQAEIESQFRLLGQTTEFENQKTLIQQKYDNARALLTQQSEDRKLGAISSGLAQSAALFKKETAAYKLLATSQAIIDTYRGAAAAVAPPPTGLGPVFGPLLAGVTVVTGLANVAKINGVQLYEGGDTSIAGEVSPLTEIIYKYKPSLIDSHAEGGYKKKPTLGLIGEKGAEWVAPPWMLRSPKFGNLFPMLESIRQTQIIPFADGGFSSTAVNGSFMNSLGSNELRELNSKMDTMIRLNQAILQENETPKFVPVLVADDVTAAQGDKALIQGRSAVV